VATAVGAFVRPGSESEPHEALTVAEETDTKLGKPKSGRRCSAYAIPALSESVKSRLAVPLNDSSNSVALENFQDLGLGRHLWGSVDKDMGLSLSHASVHTLSVLIPARNMLGF
jgi:hypothetical protein